MRLEMVLAASQELGGEQAVHRFELDDEEREILRALMDERGAEHGRD